MKLHNVRLTEHQSMQLDYLTEVYGSQATAFRTAIDLLYTLRRMDELKIFKHLDIDKLNETLRDPSTLPIR